MTALARLRRPRPGTTAGGVPALTEKNNTGVSRLVLESAAAAMRKTRDVDIRRSLDAEVQRAHSHEVGTLILHELGLCQGAARVDVAVVNGSMHGYEIKSEADTLERLPSQQQIYSRTFDFVTIVTATKHAKDVRARVPKWWGIWAAELHSGKVVFRRIRAASRNRNVDPFAVAELLWRDEALAELENLSAADGLRSKTRRVIWQTLAYRLSSNDLCHAVRERLKRRGERWRIAGVTQV
jgi:hypothetical protein